ncbi:MAG: tetratricopeptide repeat protein, partial [Myxococcales bacterium]|nr:tetratricopeptide repeat protein [Myxococcales bacterium]
MAPIPNQETGSSCWYGVVNVFRHGFKLNLRVILLTSAVVLSSACTTPQVVRDWEAGLSQAERLVDDDEYGAALAEFESLERDAPDGSDRRYVIYQQAYMHERMDHFDAAISDYMRLLNEHERFDEYDEYTARGIYRLGVLLYWELGDTEQGVECWKHVVDYFPDVDGPAHRALDGLIVHWEEDGAPEALEFFESRATELAATRMGDNMLYWAGYWYMTYQSNDDAALERFQTLR